MKPKKNIRGNSPIYEDSLKIAIARDYLTGNLSLSQVAEKHRMAGQKDTIAHFVRWYRKHYGSEKSKSDPPLVLGSGHVESKSAEALDKELSAANLKIAALEIMIQVAEEELGIAIRKKSGTKQ